MQHARQKNPRPDPITSNLFVNNAAFSLLSAPLLYKTNVYEPQPMLQRWVWWLVREDSVWLVPERWLLGDPTRVDVPCCSAGKLHAGTVSIVHAFLNRTLQAYEEAPLALSSWGCIMHLLTGVPGVSDVLHCRPPACCRMSLTISEHTGSTKL